MATVLITGCNRGIGLEFVKQYLARGDHLIASCRNIEAAPDLAALAMEHKSLRVLELDVANDASLQAFAGQLQGEAVDIFINNAGVYGPKQTAFGEVDAAAWGQVMRINAIAPLILSQLLMANLELGKTKKILFLSSKMGSIGDNQGGGSYVYRSSKTALNQVVKSLSIDLSERQFKVAALHPGWVQTDMGGPNALIDVHTSVSGMMAVIEGLGSSGSGQFLNYDGSIIPW
ncbi:MAG: short-chain dehydrogenase [SAR86 cluster bacterium]|uniref:Short-chain dehydrogenase n=1 Tax=SAR86 cluster bacterium TaxID=2030880 RepID=A0A2A4MN41_9GAMM|nr:MAG: short-chain dehydrogenase [SAR86 cluster bacterium]